MRPAPLFLLGTALLAAPAGADGPVTQQQLTASPAPGARFGSAVAIGETVLAVGAYLDGGGNGAIYVYRRNRSDGKWGFPTRIQGAQGEQLGYSVAIDDTAQILIVGAPFAPGGGAVYRFPLSDLTRETLILPHQAGAEIGCAVAAAGGIVAVGACGKGGTGSVYLLEKLEGDGDALLELDLPVAPGDRAGTAVALSPDGRTVVAGAPFHAGTGPASGAAYVSSRRPDGIWSQPVPLPATPRAEDAFGYGVATDGTFIAVGAPLDDARGQDAGAVYVFQKSGGGWSPTRQVTAGAAGDQLGVSVALDSGTILAGTRRHGPVRHAGAAYLISVDGTMGNPLLAQPQSAGAELGFAVALRGDTALAGAFLADGERGAAYVFAPSVQIAADPPLQAPKSQAFLPLPVSVVTADGQPPRSPITVDLTCSGPAASHLTCPAQVTFPPGSATIQLVDPSAVSGDLSFTITLTSPVGAFLGSPASVDATFKDTLPPSIVVDPISLVTCEGCPSTRFTVRLATQPTADVTVSLVDESPTQVTVSATSLRFTSGTQGNWSVPQTVTVTAVDDPLPEADPTYTIQLTAPGLSPVNVSVEVLDNDQVTGTERACSLGPGEILFTFVLTDHGAAQAEVDLTDALPPDLLTVYAAASDAGAATLDPITNAVTWRTPLTSAAPATLTLVAGVVPGTDGRIVSDQATFVYDADGDGVDETSNTTDDPDSPLPHTANRATIWKLGDTAHPLPACPSSPE